MQLKSILDICQANETEKFNYTVLKGSTDTEVTGIASDSRKVTEGGIFVCIVGAVSDGHKYIEQVKDKAAVIVVQKGSDYALPSENVTVIECDNTRLALALMSAAYYGNPDKELFTIGITGTKGKTTTTYMIKNVLCACGIKTGLKEIADKFGIRIACVTSELKGKAKTAILKEIETGEITFVVGTQSLFSEKLNYSRLGLVITDEEHRFGVKQREALEKKALSGVHVITMSATPLPRSVADAVYGENKEIVKIGRASCRERV